MKAAKPKILLWDLETSHNLVASFTLRPEYINYENIIAERSIICGAWKWHGEKKVHSTSIIDNLKDFEKNRHDDKQVVTKIKEALEQADAIVAHNGDKFDLKYFNTRLLYHGLEPINKPITIDTLKVARRNFSFNSNRLDYIGKYLGLGQKIKTYNAMWLAVVDSSVPLKDAVKLIKQMIAYNKQDVLLLERVYDKLKPYINNHPNHNLFNDSPIPLCPNCGSDELQRRGFRLTKTGRFQSFQCMECASWCQDTKAIDKTTIK